MSVQHQRAIASIHLTCMNVLVCAGACVSECVRYRPGENNYVYGYMYKCMLVFLTANKCMYTFFFSIFLRFGFVIANKCTHFFSHFLEVCSVVLGVSC